MAKIKNMGTATMRFGEGIIVKGNAGTDSYALVVTGSAYVDEDIKLKGKLDVIASDINNDVAIEINAANNDVVAMRFGNNATEFGYNLIYSGSGTGNNNSFTIQTDGGSGDTADVEALKMLQDGSTFIGESGILAVTGSRVGIGTTSPGNVLHVLADVSDYAVLIDNDQSSSGHGLKVTSDGTGSGTNVLDIESASTTLFRVRGDGRVGIGKVSSLPAAVLTVSSSNSDSDLAIAHKIHHIGDSNTYIEFGDDEIQIAAGGYVGLVLEESTSGVDRIYLGGPDDDTALAKKYAQVLVMSGGSGASANEANYTDTNFFVSGSIGSRGTNIRGTAVFGGDMSVSGTIGVGNISILELADDDIPPHTADFGEIYAKSSDSKLYFKNDSGTEFDLTLGASNVAGSNGNLQYNNGGSMGGASALTFDDVNNRLGINQSSPQHRLDVAGSARFLSGDIIVDQNTDFRNSSDSDNIFLTPVKGSGYGTALLNTKSDPLLLSSSADINIDASGAGVSTGKIHFDETGTNRAYLELGLIPRFHSMNHLTMSANNDIYLDADGGQIYMANGEVNYFTFNLDSTPQVDVLGDLLIDGSGDIVIDSADDFIIKNSTVQRIQVEDLTGDVAIGNHDPSYRLDVQDSVSTSFVANFENTNSGTSSDVLRLQVGRSSTLTTNNSFIDLLDGGGGVNGRIRGNGSGGITYSSAFTGQHPTSIASLTNVTTGMIVDSTGEIWSKYEENMETGIPKVAVTNSQDSKRVFGVIANLSGSFEGMVKASNQLAGETHIEINSLGEGLVWITNINGNVENGDYITSSDVFGLGQKQSDDILRSCTVAKCTEQIAWSSVSDSITHNGVSYKKYLSMCTYHCG
jgi:hypothetical protein